MMQWTKPFYGVQHLRIQKGKSLRQITLEKYETFVRVYALGPEGFTALWEQWHDSVEKAKSAGEQYATVMAVGIESEGE